MSSGKGLAGRVVAVTGANRGIGRAVVDLLTAQGAFVIGGARTVEGLSMEGARFLPLDVMDEASVRAFADAAVRAGVDSLVNNAGVGSFGPVEEVTPEEYRRVMDTNVLGLLLVTGALIPHFRRRHTRGQTSQVVNVTSDVSGRTFTGGALYTASKHAARAVTRALAYEGRAYDLRVTEIRPGRVDTSFGGVVRGAQEQAERLRPAEVARAVLYALTAPPDVRVDEVLLHPLAQEIAF